jgi:predicted secreted protein
MATHTGSEGTLKVGANTIAEIRSYSLEETADTVEDTSMGDSYRSFKTTLKGWSGSVDVFWDETDTLGQGGLVVGAEATINVFPEGASAGVSEKYYTGTAIVTGKTITGSFDGMVESTITLQGTGALTEATLA